MMKTRNLPLTLEERKAIQLEILQTIHDFCQENHLTYFLTYGTMLGAIRHKGFIPWDDDLDIMMPQNDFERLQKFFQSERYSINTCYNTKSHILPFARVIDNSTFHMVGNTKLAGLFIDIYQINGMPSSVADQNNLLSKIRIFTRIRKTLTNARLALMRRNLWPFGKSLYIERLSVRYLEKLQRTYHLEKSPCGFVAAGNKWEVYDRQMFEEGILVPFEDREFYVPKRYDDFLSAYFGNYMQFPPVDQQKPMHGSNYYMVNEAIW